MPPLTTPPSHILTVLIETPRGSFIKRGVRGGKLVGVWLSPLPCPFDYGSCSGIPAPDGAERDAVWLGVHQRAGATVRGKVAAVVEFADHGVQDDKWVVTQDGEITAVQIRKVAIFFAFYAAVKWALGKKGRYFGVKRVSPTS